MNKKEKIEELLNDKEYIKQLITSEHILTRKIKFTIEGKPENYVRERSGRGNHFYNPKADKMEKYKNEMLHSMTKEEYNFTRILINNKEDFTVEIDAEFYIQTQKSSSIKDTVKKELKLIVPNSRPDLDNFEKFILDSMHGVVYDDDSKVTKINATKYYSINPRTELTVYINYKGEKDET